jgi:hypothetical protein
MRAVNRLDAGRAQEQRCTKIVGTLRPAPEFPRLIKQIRLVRCGLGWQLTWTFFRYMKQAGEVFSLID